MKYKDIIEQWNKSRETSFDYKFEVGKAFTRVYQDIAKKLGYQKEGFLNDYMKVFPISEINEDKMATTSYSLQGAITYEKFGWSSLILQIDTNSSKTELGLPKGVYRFVFYIKQISDNWHFFIDDIPYKKDYINDQPVYRPKSIDLCFCSKESEYTTKIEKKIFDLLKTKISWDKNYIEEITLKYKEIQSKFCKHLEVDPSKVKFYSEIENIKSDSGYLSYEIQDWSICSFSLLLEIDENTYPKVNYLYSFHLKNKEGKWIIKLSDEDKEYSIENEEMLLDVINNFSSYKDTFKQWLTSGEE